MWWPALGGLVVGAVGYFAPRTLGVGYDNITDVLSGTMPLNVILFLCLLKFLSWAIALGSGTSGGTLAPLLTIGGATGALLGMGALYLFPNSGITLPFAALVGMSAMFAGASRALLTSIIFALETTGQANALLPLLGACVGSYAISFFLMRNTIMTEKIARRGVRTPHSYEQDILEKTSVEQVLNQDEVVLSEENSVKEVKEWLGRENSDGRKYFVIVSRDAEYLGILDSSALLTGTGPEEQPIASLIRSKPTYISLDHSLRAAVEIMAEENTDVLAVVDKSGRHSVVGTLSYKEIISAYKRHLDHHKKKDAHISLRRRSLRIILRGQKLIAPRKEKDREEEK
jgi:CBS domain-containing protein